MISALIAASVALLIFAWTQWVTGLRSRHDLLRSKLEELCRVVVSLRGKVIKAATGTLLPDELAKQKEVLSQIRQGIVDEILTIQMLGSLYFPSLSEHIFRVAQAAEASIGRREHFGGGGEATSFQILVNSKAFSELAKHAQDLLGYVNLEYAVLTESPRAMLSAAAAKVFT